MFGMVRGQYFGEPPFYVDKGRPAGMTDLPKPTITSWIRNTPFVLITTPNFIWALIDMANTDHCGTCRYQPEKPMPLLKDNETPTRITKVE